MTFTETSVHLEFPIVSRREDAYVFGVRGTDVLSVTRLVDGRGGNVNQMVEKAMSCAATTRNWNTIERIVRLHDPPRSPTAIGTIGGDVFVFGYDYLHYSNRLGAGE